MGDFASCCVLSYNRVQFLRRSLPSLRQNAEYPVEIIVHDDGSDQPLMSGYLDNAIGLGEISTLVRNPPGHNQGQGIALNRMFDIARGDPIVKLDHDLIYQPGWLRKAIDILDRNRGTPIEGEPRIGALGLFHYHAPPVEHNDMFIKAWPVWEEVQDFVGSGFLVPRDVWEELRPFEERSAAFAEDIDFKKRAQEKGYALALPPDDLVENIGFGLGPSTVAVEIDGQLTAHPIKKKTYVLGGK